MKLTRRGRGVVAALLTVCSYLIITAPPLWWVR